MKWRGGNGGVIESVAAAISKIMAASAGMANQQIESKRRSGSCAS